MLEYIFIYNILQDMSALKQYQLYKIKENNLKVILPFLENSYTETLNLLAPIFNGCKQIKSCEQ